MATLTDGEISRLLNEYGVPALEEKYKAEILADNRARPWTATLPEPKIANLRKDIVRLLKELSTSSDARPDVSRADINSVLRSNNGSMLQMKDALQSRLSTHVNYWNEKAQQKQAASERQGAGLTLTSQQQAILDSEKKAEAAEKAAPTQDAAALKERIKNLSEGLGITEDEAAKRIRAAALTEDQATKELILFRGVGAATGAATSAAGGGGGGGGGYIAPPTTYDFTTIVTPQGGSEIWKRGSDGTLVSTGIKVQQPLQNIGTDRNGNLVGIDPTTNKTVLIQEGYSFPQQDPSVVTTTDRTTGKSYALNTRTGEQRELGTYDFPQISPERTFQETAALSRLGPALTARGQDIQSAQYETDLGTKKFGTIRDILASPTDYVARAFLSQGQAAPGGQITAADLINSLTNIVGAYKAPSPFEQYIGRANVAVPISQPAPIRPTPTPTPTVAPAAAAPAQTFGGFSLQNLKDMQAKGVPAYAFTPEQQSALGITYTPTAPTTPQPSVQTTTPTSSTVPQVQTPTPVTGGATLTGGINPNPAASVADLAMAHGGYTREPAFIVGDARDGHQTGYEEMIVNPTGAPLKVVPNSRLPRFADGSDYREYQRWELRNPTLGEFITDPLIRLPRSGNALADAGIGFVEESTSPLGLALMALGGPVLGKVGGKVASPLIRRFLPSAAKAAETAGVGVPAAEGAASAVASRLGNRATAAIDRSPAAIQRFLSEAEASGRFGSQPNVAGTVGRSAKDSWNFFQNAVPETRIAGLLPERASASVIPAPAGNIPFETLSADIANFARNPGMFNRLPLALREARSSLTAEARPFTRNEVASLFKRYSQNPKEFKFTDRMWENIKRIEENYPESAQVMRRGLPGDITEIVSDVAGPQYRGSGMQRFAAQLDEARQGQARQDILDALINQSGLGREYLSNLSPEEIIRIYTQRPNIGSGIQQIGSPLPQISNPLPTSPAGLPMPRSTTRLGPTQAFRFAEGTGYLPRYAVGSDNVVGAAGSGATGVTPSDVSMGYLSGPAYDWYDAGSGSYGYGAFNPGSPEPTVSGVATPAPAGTLPTVQGAPSTPITQQSIVDMARKWSPPRVSAVLGEQQVGPMQLPVRSASYRQTSNLTPEDVQAFGTRLAAEGTSLTDYSALQKGLFGAKRTSRRGRLVI